MMDERGGRTDYEYGADALLLSVINLFGHEWWQRQKDARTAGWYRAACDHLRIAGELEADPVMEECALSWHSAAASYYRERILRKEGGAAPPSPDQR